MACARCKGIWILSLDLGLRKVKGPEGMRMVSALVGSDGVLK